MATGMTENPKKLEMAVANSPAAIADSSTAGDLRLRIAL